MNRWIEEKTHNKITEMIDEDDLTDDLVTVLVNTLYFNGTWEDQFDFRRTKKQAFHVNSQKQIDVDMMKTDSNFNYYKNNELKAEFIELPYVGGDVSMTIVLPNEIDGLSGLEAQLANVFVRPKYNAPHIDLTMPKFKIETTIKFQSILESLGIVNAFTHAADFTGIIDSPPLKVSKVVQKNYIEVHEKGTEASSATGMFISMMSMPRYIVVDRPFIFYIKHKDVIMFVGRYISPEA